jgi:hypothetical protein
MPIVTQVVGDNCKIVKQHTNHRLMSYLENNSLCVEALALTPDWATKSFADSSEYPCSRSCAIEASTRWMNALYDKTEGFSLNGKTSRGLR